MIKRLALISALFLCLPILLASSLLGGGQLASSAVKQDPRLGASSIYVSESRIIVEGADAVWEATTQHSQGLVSVAKEVPARILAEYADSVFAQDLAHPQGLSQAAGDTPARVLVEYADSIFSQELLKPEQLTRQAATVSPRILIEYADSILSLDLERPEIIPTPAPTPTPTPSPTHTPTATPTPAPTPTPEQIERSGKIGGGGSARISVELNAGETMQGEIMPTGKVGLYIEDPTGEVAAAWGYTKGRNFAFTAKMGGRHTLVIKNYLIIGSVNYTLTYAVIPPAPSTAPTPTTAPTPSATAAPSPTATPTPTSEPTPKPGEASVYLHLERINVLVGDEIPATLSIANSIAKPQMTVRLILKVPSGMSASSAEFIESGAGQYTGTFKVNTGKERHIRLTLRGNEPGEFTVRGDLEWYFGEDVETLEAKTQTFTVTVRSEVVTPAGPPPAPEEGGGMSLYWLIPVVFGALGLIVGIIRLVVVLGKRP